MLYSGALNVEKGSTQKIVASVQPDSTTNKKVIWETSNASVATVKDGVITGKGVGSCRVTAKAADGSGVSASCKVTVIQSVKSVSVSEKKVVLMAGESQNVNASVSPNDATNKSIRWSSSNSFVATVSSTGKIIGKDTGYCEIEATASDGSNKKATIKVTVEPSNPISLDSIGFGVYNYNLLGITVTNKCSTKKIVDFDFDLTFYNYSGSVVNSGSFSLGTQVTINPNSTKTIKRTIYGAGQAYKTIMTITGVLFSDGTYWSIPEKEQETWSFTR